MMIVIGAIATGCSSDNTNTSKDDSSTSELSKSNIEKQLNLRNNDFVQWTYNADSDTWTMGIVSAVAKPVIEQEEGVSVCIPAMYVSGIDTNKDGVVDVVAGDTADTVVGHIVIDEKGEIENANGQVYSSYTAPLILSVGSNGYDSVTNTLASSEYAKDGYINVSCGNRGGKDSIENEEGKTVYVGDSPAALVDLKAAARFVKFNVDLGNLPGDSSKLIVTGSTDGGSYATLLAASGNSKDFYPYLAELGAAGVYSDGKGGFLTGVTVNESNQVLSDGVWGCIAYGAPTPALEGDMAQAFEYNLDSSYSYISGFQDKLAEQLSDEYMNYINRKDLSVDEATIGLDIDGNGKTAGVVELKMEYDKDKYADTNGYGGTYVNLYHAKFESALQRYLDNLDYAQGWTWFDESGKALSDEDVASMTHEDRVKAFLSGRYFAPGLDVDSTDNAEKANDNNGTSKKNGHDSADSSSYVNFDEMLSDYESDLVAIQKGDEYGNDVTHLYDPLEYIGKEGVSKPTWIRIVMGASDGSIPLMSSLNLQLAWFDAGADTKVEWQWNCSDTPSEVFGDSFAFYVDEMFGYYVKGANLLMKADKVSQTENGDAEKANGQNISEWAKVDDKGQVSFSLKDGIAYRNAHAYKPVPGFDMTNYGAENYIFGDDEKDARHWDAYLVDTLKESKSDFAKLFNSSANK